MGYSAWGVPQGMWFWPPNYIHKGFELYYLRMRRAGESWGNFTCRHMFEFYQIMRIIKFCGLLSHHTLVSNLISKLHLQFNHKLLTV